MALILSEKYKSVWSFYSNRAVKIFPIYFTCLIIAVFIDIVSVDSTISTETNPLKLYIAHEYDVVALSYFVFANVTLVGQDVIQFMALSQHGKLQFVPFFQNVDPQLWRFLFVPQAWTLSWRSISMPWHRC